MKSFIAVGVLCAIAGLIIGVTITHDSNSNPLSKKCKRCQAIIKPHECFPYVKCGQCGHDIQISHRCNNTVRQHMLFETNVNVLTKQP